MKKQRVYVSWRCECGYVLGLVTRRASKGKELAVLWETMSEEELAKVPEERLKAWLERPMIRIKGNARVKCMHCGRVRVWKEGVTSGQ